MFVCLSGFLCHFVEKLLKIFTKALRNKVIMHEA
jgi:hypothetical protein